MDLKHINQILFLKPYRGVFGLWTRKKKFGEVLGAWKTNLGFFAIILWTSGQKKQFGFSGSFQKIFGLGARQAKLENFMITLNGLGTDKQNLAGCNSSKEAFGLRARHDKLGNFMITLNGLGTDKQNSAGCNSSK